MPKKFTGENSKAAAARERKATAKNEEQTKKQKAAEDAYWADDDKNVQKKLARKEDEERKRLEAVKRKEENRRAAEEEMQSFDGKAKAAATKVTQAAIVARNEAMKKEREKQAHLEKLAASKIVVTSDEVEKNVNADEAATLTARNVDEAISLLSIAAQEENPTLRLSQLKQLLNKEWLKAPENPLNQTN